MNVMPQKNISLYFFIFLTGSLLIFGIIFTLSARAEPYTEQDRQLATAKANSLSPDSRARMSPDLAWEFSSPSPSAHFEPFLLLMLGTFLLCIATGISFFRTRRERAELPAAAPQAGADERLSGPEARRETR